MTYTVNARAGLNLRAAPSTTAAILRALPYGTEVESLADPVGHHGSGELLAGPSTGVPDD